VAAINHGPLPVTQAVTEGIRTTFTDERRAAHNGTVGTARKPAAFHSFRYYHLDGTLSPPTPRRTTLRSSPYR
jgi:hypothetical protein